VARVARVSQTFREQAPSENRSHLQRSSRKVWVREMPQCHTGSEPASRAGSGCGMKMPQAVPQDATNVPQHANDFHFLVSVALFLCPQPARESGLLVLVAWASATLRATPNGINGPIKSFEFPPWFVHGTLILWSGSGHLTNDTRTKQ